MKKHFNDLNNFLQTITRIKLDKFIKSSLYSNLTFGKKRGVFQIILSCKIHVERDPIYFKWRLLLRTPQRIKSKKTVRKI